MQQFIVANGLKLAGDIGGDPQHPSVVLLHGGGQTRHSWSQAFATLVEAGCHVASLDARGHGDSDWAPDGDYGLDALVSDLAAWQPSLSTPPVLVGASLGGMTALTALGEGVVRARALVLVDITPRIDPRGVQHITDFMAEHLGGFANVQQAVDAVMRYNPNRRRAPSAEGLMRNLRLRDGRYFWHWDPRVLQQGEGQLEAMQSRLESAARRVTLPTLMVRGAQSDVVGDAEEAHFRALMPHAECVSVGGAGHMVAGDRNDAFNQHILDFIRRLDAQRAPVSHI
jgi:pimeloyl-ACP methyl ester carboxylesterase